MKINRLVIKNHKIIKDLLLDFSGSDLDYTLFCGENGTGKSTILELLACFVMFGNKLSEVINNQQRLKSNETYLELNRKYFKSFMDNLGSFSNNGPNDIFEILIEYENFDDFHFKMLDHNDDEWLFELNWKKYSYLDLDDPKNIKLFNIKHHITLPYSSENNLYLLLKNEKFSNLKNNKGRDHISVKANVFEYEFSIMMEKLHFPSFETVLIWHFSDITLNQDFLLRHFSDNEVLLNLNTVDFVKECKSDPNNFVPILIESLAIFNYEPQISISYKSGWHVFYDLANSYIDYQDKVNILQNYLALITTNNSDDELFRDFLRTLFYFSFAAIYINNNFYGNELEIVIAEHKTDNPFSESLDKIIEFIIRNSNYPWVSLTWLSRINLINSICDYYYDSKISSNEKKMFFWVINSGSFWLTKYQSDNVNMELVNIEFVKQVIDFFNNELHLNGYFSQDYKWHFEWYWHNSPYWSNYLRLKNISIYTDLLDTYPKLFSEWESIWFFGIDITYRRKSDKAKIINFSSWENKLINFLYKIFNFLKQTDKTDVIIFIDEPEIHLHPSMEQNFLSMLKMVINNFKWKNVTVFIATHSTFIPSDFKSSDVYHFSLKDNFSLVYRMDEEHPNFELFWTDPYKMAAYLFWLDKFSWMLSTDFFVDRISFLAKYIDLDEKDTLLKNNIEKIRIKYMKKFKLNDDDFHKEIMWVNEKVLVNSENIIHKAYWHYISYLF